MTGGIFFGVAVMLGWTFTAIVRKWCFRLGILDRPNERSLHVLPTPTLGGLGLMLGFWGTLGFGEWMNIPLPDFAPGLLWASLVLCVLVVDEVRPMGRIAKLTVQVVAAWCVVQAGVMLEDVDLPGRSLELGDWRFATTFTGLIVLQNLYNFMDGLDGFAGLEGVLVSGALCGLLWGFFPQLAFFALALCGASLGFFVWNKPPARIFMGDVGSHFLALCFGVIVVRGSNDVLPFYVLVMPLGAFLFDAVYTLFRRLLRGENITLAHRFHLYQRLLQMGWTPWAINGLYAVVTLLLGLSAYALVAGFELWGTRLGVFVGLLMVMGTVWVERAWFFWQGMQND